MYSDTVITGLGLDSRTIEAGALFLAQQGTSQHGLQYARQARERGVGAIAWEPGPHAPLEYLPDDLPCIRIPGLQQQVGAIARRFYHNPSQHLHVTGVTGTDGKTSVSQFLAQAWTRLGVPCAVIGTLGYGIHPALAPEAHTTPDAIRMHALLHGFLEEEIRQVVIEASSHGLKQGRLNGVDVDTAIFTNLGHDHMDYHADREDYANSKRTLFQVEGLKHAVINVDDAFGRELAEQAGEHTQVIRYSCTGPGMDRQPCVLARDVVTSQQGTVIEIASSWGSGTVKTGLRGKFNVSNLLAVAGALLANGHAFDEVIAAVSHVQSVPGRMEWIQAEGDVPEVVVDYAHTPEALSCVLQVLRQSCTGRLWCVFGCGGERDRAKRKPMAQAVESLADHGVLTDDNPRFEDPKDIVRDVIGGFSARAQYTVIHDRRQAIASAIHQAKPGDTVLIAGKGHETVQLVEGQALPFDDRQVVAHCLREYPA